VKIAPQETLAELVATAGGGRARDALDQRCPGGGDGLEQAVIISSKWRVHAGSSWSRRVRCRVRVAHVVARPQVALVVWHAIIHAAGTGPGDTRGAAIMTARARSAPEQVREVS